MIEDKYVNLISPRALPSPLAVRLGVHYVENVIAPALMRKRRDAEEKRDEKGPPSPCVLFPDSDIALINTRAALATCSSVHSADTIYFAAVTAHFFSPRRPG